MELAGVKNVMRERVPVMYDGVRYEYIRACIMRLSEKGAFTYSLELLDSSLSAVVIAPIEEVEVHILNAKKGGV